MPDIPMSISLNSGRGPSSIAAGTGGVKSLDSLIASLSGHTATVGVFAREAIKTTGLRGLALARANASGRPGPRVRTGNFRRSINVAFSDGGLTATVSTAAPQAERLEFGFVGADSLGRVYNQPPYPYMRPMAEQIQSEWANTMAAVAVAAARASGL